jgi:hypothetical protein
MVKVVEKGKGKREQGKGSREQFKRWGLFVYKPSEKK